MQLKGETIVSRLEGYLDGLILECERGGSHLEEPTVHVKWRTLRDVREYLEGLVETSRES